MTKFQRLWTAEVHSKIATDRSPIDARAPNEHISTGPGWGQIWVLGVGLGLEGGEKAFPSEQVLTGMRWSNGDSPVDRQTDKWTGLKVLTSRTPRVVIKLMRIKRHHFLGFGV